LDCRAHREAAQKDLSDLIAVERGAV
jgi:hypothetical protein